jgi:hypothetical protein
LGRKGLDETQELRLTPLQVVISINVDSLRVVIPAIEEEGFGRSRVKPITAVLVYGPLKEYFALPVCALSRVVVSSPITP